MPLESLLDIARQQGRDWREVEADLFGFGRGTSTALALPLVIEAPLSQVQGNGLTLRAAHEVLCARAKIEDAICITSRLEITIDMSRYERAVGELRRSLVTPYERAREIQLAVELESAKHLFPRPREEWRPIPGLRAIFRPNGLFRSPDGRRFDYVFPELMKHPDAPLHLLPKLADLCSGSTERSTARYGGQIWVKEDDGSCRAAYGGRLWERQGDGARLNLFGKNSRGRIVGLAHAADIAGTLR